MVATNEQGKLMHDFNCKSADEMFIPVLAEQVRYFKESEGGREIMCRAMEEMRNEVAVRTAEKQRIATLLENIKNLMDSLKVSAEEAMRLLKVSEADQMLFTEKLNHKE